MPVKTRLIVTAILMMASGARNHKHILRLQQTDAAVAAVCPLAHQAGKEHTVVMDGRGAKRGANASSAVSCVSGSLSPDRSRTCITNI